MSCQLDCPHSAAFLNNGNTVQSLGFSLLPSILSCRSDEGVVCVEALLELQRRVERNEKLLAAKDNEIRALREQVELQRD